VEGFDTAATALARAFAMAFAWLLSVEVAKSNCALQLRQVFPWMCSHELELELDMKALSADVATSEQPSLFSGIVVERSINFRTRRNSSCSLLFCCCICPLLSSSSSLARKQSATPDNDKPCCCLLQHIPACTCSTSSAHMFNFR
jgi:hypothetical protein